MSAEPQALKPAPIELRALHWRLYQLLTRKSDAEQRVLAILELVLGLTNAAGAAYSLRDSEGGMKSGPRILSRQALSWHDNLEQLILDESARACSENKLLSKTLDEARQSVLLCCPVHLGEQREKNHAVALVLVLGGQSLEMFASLLQLSAGYLSVPTLVAREATAKLQADGDLSGPLLKTLLSVLAAPDFKHSALFLLNHVQQEFDCQRVVLGLRHGRRCRIEMVSELRDIKRQADFYHAAEGVMNTALMLGETLDSRDHETRRVHSDITRLLTLTGSESLLCLPLRVNDNEPVHSVLLLLWALTPEDKTYQQVERLLPSLGLGLHLAKRGNPSLFTRLRRHFRQHPYQRLALFLVPVIITLILSIPVDHKINGEVTMEPTVRRIISAPFDGILEKTLHEAGDIVQENELLARMDGREMNWKLTGLEAERNRAIKRKDASRAARDTAATQIAVLEIEGLDAEIALLRNRLDNLGIKSPLGGVLLSGDLEREEGSPLTQGQSLFEVAPLQEMLVELAVPGEDIAYVDRDMPLRIYLDAYPGEHWDRKVERIRPRARVQGGQNVFIIEARLDNPEERLRPGMRGQGQVISGQRALGWVLFHKVGEKIASWFR